MSRKPTPPSKPASAILSSHDIQLAIPRLKKRLAEVELFDPNAVDPKNPDASVAGLSNAIDETLARTFGNDTADYYRYRDASRFNWPRNIFEATPIYEIRASLEKCRTHSISVLNSCLKSLEERLEEFNVAPNQDDSPKSVSNRKIFLVHGHDIGPRESVARFLEKIGFNVIILHEQPNLGATVIEKFERNADVGFAVVLLTPDDTGGVLNGEQRPRPRQNVILELGYFIGRLGRERVFALKFGDMELPSDILGVVWSDFDSAGGWKAAITKDLIAAGYPVDWNKVMT